MSDEVRSGPVRPAGRGGFDTAAHPRGPGRLRHLIHCAVDASTRKAVADQIEYARRVGDVSAVPILIARLGGPCTLPPARPATTEDADDGDASRVIPAPRTECGDNRKEQR